VVLALGALQKVENNEARHVFEMRLAREPDLLEITFRALLHLEPIHGDVHSRLLPGTAVPGGWAFFFKIIID